ncbi:MAG TPA: CHRD domain-containing protein [Candidatus Limnocylindria bacterium]
MKRALILVAAAGLLAAACGGGAGQAVASPTPVPTPTPTPTQPTSLVFTADLSPANENPPITDAEQSGSGTATVTLDLTRDSTGKITAAKAMFEFVLKGFPSTTDLILAHIHLGDAKTNGGVKVDSGLKADSPTTLTTGGTTVTKSDLTVDAALAADIIANPANYYFNVHSKVHPGGVARGQLKLKA